MVQPIRNFDEGCRRRLGIVIECRSCGKRVTYRCQDFIGYIQPAAEIEALRWRCSWCRTPADSARYVIVEKMDRQDLAQWKPPPWGWRRRDIGRHVRRPQLRLKRPWDGLKAIA